MFNEAARYDNRFERGCVAATAEYSRRSDGDIKVVNTCWRKDEYTSQSSIGKAWIVEGSKLKLSFVPIPIISSLAAGDYWVIYTDYDNVAIIGNPTKKYGWILTRDPQMSDAAYESYTKYLEVNSYDAEKL